MKIDIAIVDNNDLYRKGLKITLERFNSIGEIFEFKSGIEFLNQLSTHDADIVLMDINMPELSGIETTLRALSENKNLKIIALTMYGEFKTLQQMTDAGAKGYILKDSGLDEIERAIIKVSGGNTYFQNQLTN